MSDSTGPVEGWEEIVLLGSARKGRLGCQPHRPGSLSTLPLPYLSVNVKKLFVCRFGVAVNVSMKRGKKKLGLTGGHNRNVKSSLR